MKNDGPPNMKILFSVNHKENVGMEPGGVVVTSNRSVWEHAPDRKQTGILRDPLLRWFYSSISGYLRSLLSKSNEEKSFQENYFVENQRYFYMLSHLRRLRLKIGVIFSIRYENSDFRYTFAMKA